MGQTKMVVGLGNPGSQYALTRHNMGFMVLDSLCEVLGIEIKQKKFGALFGTGDYEDNKLILLKPWQYMNLSGQVVATATGFYKLPISDLIVVTDDMALEPGRIRVRKQGSAGGHNGLSDIIDRLGTNMFARLRVGVGQSGQEIASDYVLSRPGPEEMEILSGAIKRASDAVLCWIKYGVNRAMNEFNPEQSE